MFTIFDLIQLIGLIAGPALGISIDNDRFGITGAIFGGIIGLILGWIVGRLPWVLAWMELRRDLRRATADDLRKRVSQQYFISHLLIAELAARGESIDDLREVVELQLHSDSAAERRFGEGTARLWYPDLVDTK